MTFFKRLILIVFVVTSCVGCDQVTKSVATQMLAQQTEAITYLNGLVRLQYAENPGAFLNFGVGISDSLRFWVFTVIVSVVLVIGFILLLKAGKLSLPITIALAFIVGGGIGNLMDRIFNDGHVVDFLNLGIGSVRTGIFNIADVAITFGTLTLLVLSLLRRGEATP
jgi:signal peptidase II